MLVYVIEIECPNLVRADDLCTVLFLRHIPLKAGAFCEAVWVQEDHERQLPQGARLYVDEA